MSLEKRLKTHGLDSFNVTHLPYVDETKETFADTKEVGKRIMILYSIAVSVHNPEFKRPIINWMKLENLWDAVSPSEKSFLESEQNNYDELISFSWKFEAAYVLAWAVGIVREQPHPGEQADYLQTEDFSKNVPAIGDNLQSFLEKLQYINKSEIYLENLFNELATAYFRDLLVNGNEDKTNINRLASFERHTALNWLRGFGGIREWDEIDTST
jgi:hypothetical protein